MGISMSERLRSHTFIEMCKTEALSACLQVLEDCGETMTVFRKDFILQSISKFITQYELDASYDLESYILVQPDKSEDEVTEEAEDFFVKASEVSAIFMKLQLRVVSMLVGLVISNFTMFLVTERLNSDD